MDIGAWRLERMLKRSQMRRDLIDFDSAYHRADEKLTEFKRKKDHEYRSSSARSGTNDGVKHASKQSCNPDSSGSRPTTGRHQTASLPPAQTHGATQIRKTEGWKCGKENLDLRNGSNALHPNQGEKVSKPILIENKSKNQNQINIQGSTMRSKSGENLSHHAFNTNQNKRQKDQIENVTDATQNNKHVKIVTDEQLTKTPTVKEDTNEGKATEITMIKDVRESSTVVNDSVNITAVETIKSDKDTEQAEVSPSTAKPKDLSSTKTKKHETAAQEPNPRLRMDFLTKFKYKYNLNQESRQKSVEEILKTGEEKDVEREEVSSAAEPLPETLKTQLRYWLASVTKWTSEKFMDSKCKNFQSLRIGTKPVDRNSMTQIGYKFKGETNYHGKPHGGGTVLFKNGDQLCGEFKFGLREGRGTLKTSAKHQRYKNGLCEEEEILYIDGTYTSDKLEGEGKIEWLNGDVTYCIFSQSCVHGFTKTYDSKQNLLHICWYTNGIPTGYIWEFTTGGGYLVGNLDVLGNLTGSDVSFLFPDLETGITGKYVGGRLEKGHPSVLKLITSRKKMYELKFRKVSNNPLKYEPGTRDTICEFPLVPDPFESKYVYIQPSKCPKMGEGIFTRKTTSPYTVLAFYNGIRLPADDIHRDEDWENDAYKILNSMSSDRENDCVVDIPPAYRSTSQYTATLAHKANHSFIPNAKYSPFYHPRFGVVPCILSLMEIKAGREIFVNYEYAFDEAPPWYTQAYTEKLLKSYWESKQELVWRG